MLIFISSLPSSYICNPAQDKKESSLSQTIRQENSNHRAKFPDASGESQYLNLNTEKFDIYSTQDDSDSECDTTTGSEEADRNGRELSGFPAISRTPSQILSHTVSRPAPRPPSPSPSSSICNNRQNESVKSQSLKSTSTSSRTMNGEETRSEKVSSTSRSARGGVAAGATVDFKGLAGGGGAGPVGGSSTGPTPQGIISGSASDTFRAIESAQERQRYSPPQSSSLPLPPVLPSTQTLALPQVRSGPALCVRVSIIFDTSSQ